MPTPMDQKYYDRFGEWPPGVKPPTPRQLTVDEARNARLSLRDYEPGNPMIGSGVPWIGQQSRADSIGAGYIKEPKKTDETTATDYENALKLKFAEGGIEALTESERMYLAPWLKERTGESVEEARVRLTNEASKLRALGTPKQTDEVGELTGDGRVPLYPYQQSAVNQATAKEDTLRMLEGPAKTQGIDMYTGPEGFATKLKKYQDVVDTYTRIWQSEGEQAAQEYANYATGGRGIGYVQRALLSLKPRLR